MGRINVRKVEKKKKPTALMWGLSNDKFSEFILLAS